MTLLRSSMPSGYAEMPELLMYIEGCEFNLDRGYTGIIHNMCLDLSDACFNDRITSISSISRCQFFG